MDTNRGRIVALVACVFLAGCGGGDGPTGPGPDPDPDPDPDPTLELKGDSIFGIGLDNRLFLVGTRSLDVVSRILSIQGLPPGHRIVGAEVRPSDRRVYGVGTDSRVYVLDTRTAVATPVSQAPFSPAIFVGVDVHFGMAFDPDTERIRLISAESGINWSIDPDDGTAVTDAEPTYAAGDPNEGFTPRIAGLSFGTLPTGTSIGLTGSSGHLDCSDQQTRAMYAFDADRGWLVGTCTPELAELSSLFEIPEFSTRCAEIKVMDDGGPQALGVLGVAYDAARGANWLINFDLDAARLEYLGEIPELKSPAQSFWYPVEGRPDLPEPIDRPTTNLQAFSKGSLVEDPGGRTESDAPDPRLDCTAGGRS